MKGGVQWKGNKEEKEVFLQVDVVKTEVSLRTRERERTMC